MNNHIKCINVLHVVGGYPNEENPSNGVFVKAQIDSLSDAGLKCDIYILKGTGLFKYLSGIFKLRKYLKYNIYDLIHSHYMYCGWTAKFAASKIPVVVSFMGSDVFGKITKNGNVNYISYFIHKYLSKLLCKFVDGIIVKSLKLKNALGNVDCEIIPNGIDTKIFKFRESVDKIKLGLNQNKKYILFAGTSNIAVKRYNLAKNAVDILKNHITEVEFLILNGKTQKEFANYLSAVDVLLLTSQHEGSSNMLKEALACNLPVVSVDVGDARERLENVDNCYIADSDKHDLSSKLRIVISNNRRSRNGRHSIEKLMIEKIAETIINYYFKILKRQIYT